MAAPITSKKPFHNFPDPGRPECVHTFVIQTVERERRRLSFQTIQADTPYLPVIEFKVIGVVTTA